jgi:hypothetical protein
MFTATTSWPARTLASSGRRLGFYDIGGDQAIEAGGLRVRRSRDEAGGPGLFTILLTTQHHRDIKQNC